MSWSVAISGGNTAESIANLGAALADHPDCPDPLKASALEVVNELAAAFPARQIHSVNVACHEGEAGAGYAGISVAFR